MCSRATDKFPQIIAAWCGLMFIEYMSSQAIPYCSSSRAVVQLRLFQVHRCTSAAGKPSQSKTLPKIGSWFCTVCHGKNDAMSMRQFTIPCVLLSYKLPWCVYGVRTTSFRFQRCKADVLEVINSITICRPIMWRTTGADHPKDHNAHEGLHGRIISSSNLRI